MAHSKELLKQYRALKCNHAETTPTVIVSGKGRKSVAFQCVVCGKCDQLVRVSKSGYDATKLPPFNYDFQERQRQARSELHTKMWNEAKNV